MTIALPMSCTSPCTVPITTLPLAAPAALPRASLQMRVAASMAWAESMSSGRNISPLSNISPTSLMPAMKPSFMTSAGAIPAAMASFATWAALSASALTIESIASRTISSFVILRLLLDVDLGRPSPQGRGAGRACDVSPATILPPDDQAGSAAGRSRLVYRTARPKNDRGRSPTRACGTVSEPCATSAPSSAPQRSIQPHRAGHLRLLQRDLRLLRHLPRQALRHPALRRDRRRRPRSDAGGQGEDAARVPRRRRRRRALAAPPARDPRAPARRAAAARARKLLRQRPEPPAQERRRSCARCARRGCSSSTWVWSRETTRPCGRSTRA